MDEQNFDPNTAINFLQSSIQKSGISPDVYVQLGQLAEQVLQNKDYYPQFANELVNLGLVNENEIGREINYQMLIAMISMGRVSQQMMAGA